MKVAIVGLSATTHDQAPWNDPTWEKWGLPWDEGWWPRCDRLFEMHDMRLLGDRKPGYLDRLQEIDVPLYMQRKYYPNVTAYPLNEVSATTGHYFNSSIGYMLALAIHEGAETIGVWGVDMRGDDEYGYQKPNAEYLLGLAMGRGINVVVPGESPLLKFHGDGIKFANQYPNYIDRYGWLGDGD